MCIEGVTKKHKEEIETYIKRVQELEKEVIELKQEVRQSHEKLMNAMEINTEYMKNIVGNIANLLS